MAILCMRHNGSYGLINSHNNYRSDKINEHKPLSFLGVPELVSFSEHAANYKQIAKKRTKTVNSEVEE